MKNTRPQKFALIGFTSKASFGRDLFLKYKVVYNRQFIACFRALAKSKKETQCHHLSK